MRETTLNGERVYVRGRRSGAVEFRYPGDWVWFALDGTPQNAKDILTRLSPSTLRAIADAKESPGV